MRLQIAYTDRVIINIIDGELESLINSPFYKIAIKRYVHLIGNDKCILLNEDMTYVSVKKLIQHIVSNPIGMEVVVDNSLHDFIAARELYIGSRSKLGIEIRRCDEKFSDIIEEYKQILVSGMVRELRPKQLWDSFYMTTMRRSCNFSVPGSGKTSSVYGMFCFLQSKGLVEQIVVVCPKNAFGPWEDEFGFCFGDKKELRLFNIQAKAYKNNALKKAAVKYDTGQANLLLFNYESIKGLETELLSIVNDKTLLVFDEVHKIKRIGGEYAKSAVKIAQNASYVTALTGTPIPNTYQDIYNVLQILFKDEYSEYFGYSPSSLRSPSAEVIQGVNTKLQPFFCRTDKESLGVPKANSDMIIPVASSGDEQDLFDILFKKHKKNKLLLMLRLLQLESNPKMLLSSLDLSDYKYILDDDTDSADGIDYVDYSSDVVDIINRIKVTDKTSQCVNLVKGLVAQGKSVVVWCIFVNSIKYLSKIFNELEIPAHAIYGEVDLETRKELLDKYKMGDFKVLITNPNTLAESISLHNICHDAIYYEYSFNLVHLLQSKDRIHRLGLKEGQYTQFYFLETIFSHQAGGYSMDEQIYQRLKSKEETMKKAIDACVLETQPSSLEDLEKIFKPLNLF